MQCSNVFSNVLYESNGALNIYYCKNAITNVPSSVQYLFEHLIFNSSEKNIILDLIKRYTEAKANNCTLKCRY